MTPVHIRRAAELYGYRVRQWAPAAAGYRSTVYPFLAGRQWRCFIVYKHEAGVLARIRRTNRFGNSLARAGLPVRATVKKRVVQLRSPRSVRYGAVYYYLPGETIAWEAFTQKHLKLLGWALSDLHAAARMVPSAGFPSVCQEYQAAVERMARYFAQEGVRAALHSKLGVRLSAAVLPRVRLFVTAMQTVPGQQLLHMDFVRGNMLFRPAHPADTWVVGGVALCGVLDLEKAAVGHPLLDIARSLAFVLADCSTKSPAQVRRYIIDSGYNKRGASRLQPLSVTLANGKKCDVLETALVLFWLHDFYTFLRSNPYESLAENYHFRRTLSLLAARGVVRPV